MSQACLGGRGQAVHGLLDEVLVDLLSQHQHLRTMEKNHTYTTVSSIHGVKHPKRLVMFFTPKQQTTDPRPYEDKVSARLRRARGSSARLLLAQLDL